MVKTNDEITNAVETVRAYAGDIQRTKKKIETVQEQIDEHLDGLPEHNNVVRLEEELKQARAKLKASLMSDADYNDLMEEKGNLSQELADQKHIMSEHLVAYFHLSGGERQIELGVNGDAREVVITGKLGKEAKFQTSLLAGGAGDKA